MKTNDSASAFSSERFSALMKSDFTVNKGNYLKHSIAVVGVFAALASLISINAVIDINSLRHMEDPKVGRVYGRGQTDELRINVPYCLFMAFMYRPDCVRIADIQQFQYEKATHIIAYGAGLKSREVPA